ncbi:amino-acid N-acetyltransferase [Thiopseudomonas denitrificans]|uniref:Amino-acid acetyltransferase n=1 Tax=Thiopseudomonas denitrificans TaxID=1501432 RepID=A0A4R6TPZ1_9GAMM|nr:amino-acid N-acetyltransferase [Thiopseudomonas denitrificans]TDQ34259.1 N-acetylglutamate synthase [Thiopseudomonas denitrificans]
MHDYVNWLRHSSPYINSHRERTFVIMLPGESLAHANFGAIVHDLVLLHSLGVRLVLVHGSRPQIEQALEVRQLPSRYHHNLRITDRNTLDCIISAAGQLRSQIEARLSVNMAASPMQGAKVRIVSGNLVTARPCGVVDGVDLLHTGEVRRIDHEAIRQLLDQRNMVLLSHLGYSPTGETFNLSCEEVATRAAIALQADKLILFSAEQGLLNDKGDLIREMSLPQARDYLQDPRNTSVRTTLQAAIDASLGQVARCHIISYQRDGALLSELFTRDGCGTLIDQGGFEQVREATIEDVGGLLELIRPLEEQGLLVRRSRDLLEQEIQQFSVVERDGLLIACAALYPFPEERTGELACLAVHPDYRHGGHGGHGDAMFERIRQRALGMGLESLFVLTTRTAHWFQERGFIPCTIDDLPRRKAALYNYQRNSKVFRLPLEHNQA